MVAKEKSFGGRINRGHNYLYCLNGNIAKSHQQLADLSPTGN